MRPDSHLTSLNSAQRKAVTYGEALPEKGWRAGPRLVVCRGGTSKLKSIAHRVGQLGRNGVDPARGV